MCSKQMPTRIVTSVFIVVSACWAADIMAYERYNDGCQDCHGQFTGPISPKGNLFPGGDKHRMHRASSAMNTDCNLCHTTGDNEDPFIGSSNGTAINLGLGCVGCHGRMEDASNDSISNGLGAGLRQHHDNAGIRVCANCHTDANPANYTPVGEDVLPPYYGTADTNADDACNPVMQQNINENWTIGDFFGLDNDGDLLYDKTDRDCNVLGADFDGDGDVDGDDFLIWQAGFNVDDRGDADGDGDTDGDDFLIWQTQFGSATKPDQGAGAADRGRRFGYRRVPRD